MAETGLTQVQLARAVGVSQQTVSKWLHNLSLPTLRHLAVLAKELGTTEAVLVLILADTVLSTDNDGFVVAVQENGLLKSNEKRLLIELYSLLTQGRLS